MKMSRRTSDSRQPAYNTFEMQSTRHHVRWLMRSSPQQSLDKTQTIQTIGVKILEELLISILLLARLYTLSLEFVINKLRARVHCTNLSNHTSLSSVPIAASNNDQYVHFPPQAKGVLSRYCWRILTSLLRQISRLYRFANRCGAECELIQQSCDPLIRQTPHQLSSANSVLARDDTWSHLLAMKLQDERIPISDDIVLRDLCLPKDGTQIGLSLAKEEPDNHKRMCTTYHNMCTRTLPEPGHKSEGAINVVETVSCSDARSLELPDDVARDLENESCTMMEYNLPLDQDDGSKDFVRNSHGGEGIRIQKHHCDSDTNSIKSPARVCRQMLSKLPRKVNCGTCADQKMSERSKMASTTCTKRPRKTNVS